MCLAGYHNRFAHVRNGLRTRLRPPASSQAAGPDRWSRRLWGHPCRDGSDPRTAHHPHGAVRRAVQGDGGAAARRLVTSRICALSRRSFVALACARSATRRTTARDGSLTTDNDLGPPDPEIGEG